MIDTIGGLYAENPRYTLKIQNEQRELYYSPFSTAKLGLFKYVSTLTVRSLGSDLQNERLLKRFSE